MPMGEKGKKMRLIDSEKLGLTDFEIAMCNGDYKEALKMVLGKIEDAPTVDAEPVKHGEWIPKITELGTMIFYCSDCSRFSDVHWAYCPRCGAKMDGEENS